MADTFEPPYEQWAEILRANVSRRAERAERLGSEMVQAVREDVVAHAQEYSRSIIDTALQCGITGLVMPLMSGSPDRPIVMAGHQPVLYHPGVLCKVHALSRLVSESEAIGVNVIIDTDEGDGGALVWPRVSSGSLEIRQASMVETGSSPIYRDQVLVSAGEISRIFSELVEDLRSSNLAAEAQYAKQAGELYARLEGQPISLAHTIVRWVMDGHETLEIPLSVVIKNTEVRNVLRRFVRDGERLAKIYNETLVRYRELHRIHNPANPFPNMRIDDGQIELPLWLIEEQRRNPVFIAQGVEPDTHEQELLAPRGSITTMILRGMCADLFIHGLGGGKYDRFVDELALAYVGVQLPRYVIASRTLHICPEKVLELTHSLDISSRVKEMISKTEQFIGKEIFSADEEIALERLSQERSVLRSSLQHVENSEERSFIAHQLNAANRKVRDLIENGSLKPHITQAAKNQASLARWTFREFPFFLYKLPRSS